MIQAASIALLLACACGGCERVSKSKPSADAVVADGAASSDSAVSSNAGSDEKKPKVKSKRNLPRPNQPVMAIRNAPRPDVDTQKMTPADLFNSYCRACHSLKLVESQRLSRDMWEWVMEDIVTDYGGSWITKEEQKILIDYLVEHYGPEI